VLRHEIKNTNKFKIKKNYIYIIKRLWDILPMKEIRNIYPTLFESTIIYGIIG
jgi:hypothetical protein